MGLRCLARADCVAVIAIVRGRDGSWARLLAVLTLQCAAKPHWWHGGQPAQVATSRVNVRMKGPRPPPAGPRPPPIGLACEVKGVSAQDAFTETQEGLTARRRPDALYMPRETTEAGPRRNPPLVAYGDRTVGAEKSRHQQHVVSYNPESPGSAVGSAVGRTVGRTVERGEPVSPARPAPSVVWKA